MTTLDPSVYYRLSSDSYGPSRVLSCYGNDPPGVVGLTRLDYFTSENWQFLYHYGTYFIRNHDHNTSYQLGIDGTDQSNPVMLPASTELAQQWRVSLWGNDTNVYKLTNRWIDDQTPGVYMGVADTQNITIMPSSEVGIRWTIEENPDAGTVSSDMLQGYSTPTLGTTSPAATSSALPTDPADSTPGHLSGLNKVAIAVASIVVIWLLLIGGYLFWRYKKGGSRASRGVPGPTATLAPRHGPAELVPKPPPSYSARPTASFANQEPIVSNGISGYYGGNGTRPKAADEESIELPPYGSPPMQSRSFV